MADAKISALPSVVAPTATDPIPLVEAGVTSRSTILAIINSGLGGVPGAGNLPIGNAGGTAYAPLALSGDATLVSTGALTLVSTIVAGGPIGSATAAPIITYDAKGRLTTVTSATITPAVASITGFGTGVATALAINVGSAGAFVTFNGALGTPSSGTLTNATGLPIAGLVASTSTAIGVGSIELGAASDTTIARSGAGAITVEGVQVLLSGAALGTPASGTVTNLTGTASININGTVGTTSQNTGQFTSLAYSTTLTGTSANSSALAVGRLGATTPALQVDASTATSITGIKIKSAASGGGVAISAIGEASNGNLTLDAQGSGTITIGGTSTGAITLTRATTMSNALTYGGVTLSNAVTGTGSMVLSTSPTFTTPILGTPTSGVGTNITGIPAANILAGSFGAGAYVISTSLQVATMELGAATDTTLSRVSAGVIAVEGVNVLTSGATGVQTFLTTPSSANLATALTDKTGTGVAVFGTAPTFITSITDPIHYGGTANSATLTLQGSSGAAPASSYVFVNPQTVAGTSPAGMYISTASADTLDAAGTSDMLHVQGSDTKAAFITVDAYGASSQIALRRADGTSASRTASVLNDILGVVGGRGYQTNTNAFTTNAASIRFTAQETFTNATNGAFFSIFTTPTSSTTAAERVRVWGGGGISINNTTDPGAGNLSITGALAVSGAVTLPGLASSSAVTTGTLCWTTGTGNVNVDTTTTCLLSSAKFKERARPLDIGLVAVLKLKPAAYFLKAEFNPTGLDEQVGFFAEDVAEVDPRLVSMEADGTPHAVRYQQMTAMLAAAIQEQHARYEALEARFTTLWNQVHA